MIQKGEHNDSYQVKYVKELLAQEMTDFPNADENVLQFIFSFLCSHATDIDDVAHVRKIFIDGYCYYFAVILQNAFPGGTIVWCAPYGHIAYEYKDVVYDIEGVNVSDVEDYIPIKYIGERIGEFKHVPGTHFNFEETSTNDINEMIDNFKKEKETEKLNNE